jgi:trans-2-enoyl-CoA reductase
MSKKNNIINKALKAVSPKAEIAQLQTDLTEANKKIERLMKALSIAYKAYKKKCTHEIFTVKEIRTVHRLCKQALPEKTNGHQRSNNP